MRLRVLVLLAAISLPLPLLADTIYHYAGNDFTTAVAPYTTSDSISGEFTLSSPLADNLTSFATITPVSFSFTDGVYALTNLTALSDIFEVETDASGAITYWFIGFSDDNLGDYFETENTQGLVGDFGEYGSDYGSMDNDPGTWSESAPSPIPEPSTIVLLATGLLGLVGAARNKFLHS